MDNVEKKTVEEIIVENTENAVPTPETSKYKYKSIADYTTLTGKRFRMLKSDKVAGLTREQAFAKRFGV